MENDTSYELAMCSHDGAQWLEVVSYTPATRWEPEDMDIADRPCVVCGSWDSLYPQDTWFGALAVAALEAARFVAYFIESLGLPTCDKCGALFFEGWTVEGTPLCWQCGEAQADEYFKQEDFDYVLAVGYRRHLLNDYFFEHGGNFDDAVDNYATQNEISRHHAIEALYWRYAFGVQAVECPQCDALTINAWEDADVWNCRPCVRADAEFECRLDYGDGEGYDR